MADFLLELLSEEIPARMQDKAREDLARLFAAELGKAGLKAEALETYATPRRLALIARGLPPETEAVREETKGPRASAPPQALEGFLRKTGLTRDQLQERDGVLFAIVEKPGRPTAAVLAEAIPALIRAFPWPKSMRWGTASASTESLRWVRPLQGLVALLGEEIVEFEIAGLRSGAATVGHRFHHSGPITLGGAGDYVEKLKACHVIVDQEERKRLVRDGARAAAEAAGLALVEDEGLVAENAGLTEWPAPLLGGFDPAFLDLPGEVIQLTMRTNQKYFALTGGEGKLAPNFLCVANIEAADGGAAIVKGNERVLSARLADAKFFWEQDLKVPLEEQAKKLGQIVFHEKLGTVADKVERVAKLAQWLVEEGIVGGGTGGSSHSPATVTPAKAGVHTDSSPGTDSAGMPASAGMTMEDLAHLADRAARLAKADLVTGLVGEFPELQGIIGGHLARAQGEPPEIADAIQDHYKPVGQGDEVPTDPVTVAVSLADKLDTVIGFFLISQPPSGSKDPYALRRATIAAATLLVSQCLRMHLFQAIAVAYAGYAGTLVAWANRLEVESGPVLQQAAEAKTLSDWPETAAFLRRTLESLEEGQQDTLAAEALGKALLFPSDEAIIRKLQEILDFFADRLKVQQREAGVRHDLIDAVFALGGEDDLVRLLARVRALQSFVETPEGADLLAGYKRAANILKKEGWGDRSTEQLPARSEGRVRDIGVGAWPDDTGDGTHPARARQRLGKRSAAPRQLPGSFPDASGAALGQPGDSEHLRNKSLSYTPEKDEIGLVAALDSAEPRARAAVETEDFEGAMAALASLRAPVDAFFDKVTVNDPDPAKRAARLDLLARIRDAVHQVADFSRIEG
jgi:glycyl-tRNA synthetase beta chain